MCPKKGAIVETNIKDKKIRDSRAVLIEYVRRIFPQVEAELEIWRRNAEGSASDEPARHALDSIKHKKFHAQGGCIYALYPGCDTFNLIPFIVALQTISDYLDNLCDRAGCTTEEKSFRQLHLSFDEALMPYEKEKSDYFLFYPYNDGGYLNSLVDECRARLRNFKGYELVQDYVVRLARLYSEMQSYKHIDLDRREKYVRQWAIDRGCGKFGISEWEYAAAAGSTLGIFVLCAMASIPAINRYEAEKVVNAYFPWVCGLHILLDYFIDQAEDREYGDLNFVSFYNGIDECSERMLLILKKSLDAVKTLPYPQFHTLVVKGLLAMYLSDPKVRGSDMIYVSRKLLNSPGGIGARAMYYGCRLLRAAGII